MWIRSDTIRKRLLWLTGAAVSMLALTASVLAAPGASAYVVPNSSTQAPDQLSATLNTPPGTTVTLSGIERLQTPGTGLSTVIANAAVAGVGDNTFAAGQNNLTFQSYSGTNFPTWASLPIPRNDAQFHPWAQATLSFEHPIADPVLTLGGFGAISLVGTTINATATFITGIPAATTPAGATITPALTLLNFTPGYTVDDNNMIQAPDGFFGAETGTRSGVPSATHDEYQRLIDSVVPDNTLTTMPRGTGDVVLDTRGQAISSLTIRIDASMLNEDVDPNSGIAANLMPRISARTPTEVSGSTTPVSYGPATHTLTDLRLGDNSVEAFASTSLTAATAGTPTDNSDAGYDALDPAEITAFMDSFNSLELDKRISLTVSMSGASKTTGVHGWLDFNGNGIFDVDEASSLATVGAGSTSATLMWTVPSSVVPGDTWLRLRTSYDSGQLDAPSGWGDSGEVEDYPVTIAQGTPQVDITKTNDLPSGGDAAVGQEVTYTMVVTNQSSTQIVPTPTVTDTLPENVSFVSADNGGVAPGDGTVVWLLPDIPAGGSVTLQVKVEVVTAAASTENTVRVTTNAGCETVGSDSDCKATNTFPAPQAVLDVVKIAPAQATILSDFSYSITVTNVGAVPATGVTVTDLLPAGLTFVAMSSGTDPQPVDPTSSVLVWTLPGTLEVGDDVTLTFTVHLDDTVHSVDTLLNRASADSDQGCTPTDLGSCQDSTSTDVVVPDGSLITEKTATIIDGGGRTTATAGDQIAFTITVSNNSTLPIDLTVVHDPMLDVAGVVLDCGTLPATINPGGTHSCTSAPYTVTPADVTAGQIQNVATGQGSYPNGEEAATGPGEVDVPTAPPTLVVTKTGPASAIAGHDIEYTVAVVNTGALPANEVTVTDTLPAGLSYLDGSGRPTPTVHEQNLVWTVPQLAPGGRLSFTFTARIDPAINSGTVTNTASVTSDGGCTPAASCADTAHTTVQSPGPLVLAKTATVPNPGSPVQPGDIVRYTITATNTGSVTLTDATFSDTLANVTDDATLTAEPTASLGTVTRSGNQINWSGTLTADQSATIAYAVQVTGAGNDTLINIVTSAAGSSNCGPDSTVAACRTSTAVAETAPPTPPSNPADGGLPRMGADLGPSLGLITITIAVGIALVWLATRRRTSR